jgi:hypothetical protein
MTLRSRKQQRAFFAKKGRATAGKTRKSLSSFSQEQANDIRLTVQEELHTRFLDNGGDPTLADVETALMEYGMPESWATSQAPELHAGILEDLIEDRKEDP